MQTDSSFTFVLFGGTGDLSMRKILPALFEAHRAGGMLADSGKIVAVARHAADRSEYLQWVNEHVKPHVSKNGVDEAAWASFLERIEFVKIDLGKPEDFVQLRDAIRICRASRVFYLATGPSLFVPICHALASVGLNENARIVLEKPLGYDLKSSNAINDAVGEIFAEEQIYRIDHYLGKEPVQNLLALRFGNALFEPLWRREWVESIQITIAEELGVEARGDFYDNTGALRDMVQNHLLQLLSIVAMEPPHSMDSDSVRDEKLRVLRALKPIDPRDIGKVAVRGQYHAGVIRGTAVPAYATEPGVKPDSTTETFVALKVEIENWRWAGVPFFLRTGKRLADRVAEIVVNFRAVPHSALGAIGVARRCEPSRDPPAAERNHSPLLPREAAGRRHEPRQRPPRPRVRPVLPRRADGGVSAPAARRDQRPPRAVRAARRAGSGMALGRTDPERMGGVEQAAEAVCIGHVGTGRVERDAGAARHLLARRRELN